jgi:prepilin-type N-terminal cleavage/methylation domain-containing protein
MMLPIRRSRRGSFGHTARHFRRPPRKGEDGFTLIELLIVLVIIPIVFGAVAMVLLTSLQNQQGIQNKLSDSSDATVSSAYYVRDVESATGVTTTSTPANGSFVCGPGGTGLTGNSSFLLGLQLAGGSTVSYYTWTPQAGVPTQLVRLFCANNAVTSPGHVTMSHSIAATRTTPGVTCLNPLPLNTPTGLTCTPSTDWTKTYLVSNITIGITQGCPTPPGPPCRSYQYTVLAAPVIGVPIPGVVPSTGPLTLLGSGTDIDFVSFFGGSFSVCAAGSILLNSGDTNVNGEAIDSSSGGNSVTSNKTSGCGSPVSPGTVAVYNCRGDHSNGTACPGKTVGGGVSVTPSPVSVDPKVSDPLQSFAASNPVPVISSAPVSCPMNGNNVTCPAGLYPNGLNIPDGKTVTFSPGNYQFGDAGNAGNGCNCDLSIGSNDKVIFSAGDYSFEGGVSLNGSNDTLCGIVASGDPNCPATGGVFFYVAGGFVNLGGFTFGNTIKLAPPTSGPYKNLLLWQNGQDNNGITIAGGGTTVNAYNGQIYAPNAQIGIYGFSSAIVTGHIVAARLSLVGILTTTTLDIN